MANSLVPTIKVISGAQSGVDLAALDVAIELGITTGGWMPKGFLTEDGPRPEYANLYGLQEMPTTDYPARTRKNIAESGATFILVSHESDIFRGGTALTLRLARSARDLGIHDVGVFLLSHPDAVDNAKRFLREIVHGPGSVSVLNIAGPRESRCPGIYERARAFLRIVLAKEAS